MQRLQSDPANYSYKFITTILPLEEYTPAFVNMSSDEDYEAPLQPQTKYLASGGYQFEPVMKNPPAESDSVSESSASSRSQSSDSEDDGRTPGPLPQDAHAW